MTFKKHVAAVCAALIIPVLAFAGCTAQPQASAPAAAASAVQSEVAQTPAPAEPEASQTEAAAAQSAPAASEGKEITDMAGRKVTLPEQVNKVFTTDSLAAIYTYTLSPDKLLGWNINLNELERKYIPKEYADLPVFGMGDSISYEAVIAAAPDIALVVSKLNDGTIADADKLSQSLGIPVVLCDNDMSKTADTYRFLGDILGAGEQAEKLAAYTEETIKAMQDTAIPEEERVTVYYGNGEDSLETAPKGSASSQIIDMVNAENIADVELGEGSRVKVSLEQVLAWNPEYMIVNGEPKDNISGNQAAQAIMEDPAYAEVTAVKNGNVLGAPKTPFSWIDRPPGPNRFIGVRWLANTFYPDKFNYDITKEVQDFYKLFYHTELTDAQVDELLTL